MRSFGELELLSNRRRGTRLSARLEVRYGLEALDFAGAAYNVSATGLYIRSDKVLKVGTRFRLLLEFPDREFRHRGEVMWAIPAPAKGRESLMYGMGVQFVGVDPGWGAFFEGWKETVEDHDE